RCCCRSSRRSTARRSLAHCPAAPPRRREGAGSRPPARRPARWRAEWPEGRRSGGARRAGARASPPHPIVELVDVILRARKRSGEGGAERAEGGEERRWIEPPAGLDHLLLRRPERRVGAHPLDGDVAHQVDLLLERRDVHEQTGAPAGGGDATV